MLRGTFPVFPERECLCSYFTKIHHGLVWTCQRATIEIQAERLGQDDMMPTQSHKLGTRDLDYYTAGQARAADIPHLRLEISHVRPPRNDRACGSPGNVPMRPKSSPDKVRLLLQSLHHQRRQNRCSAQPLGPSVPGYGKAVDSKLDRSTPHQWKYHPVIRRQLSL